MYYSTPKEVLVAVDSLLQNNRKVIPTEEIILTQKVPDVKGMPAMEALAILEQMGLKVILKGKGKVKRQSLRFGSSIKSNSTIILELS